MKLTYWMPMALLWSFPIQAQPVEVVPQIALRGAAVLVADEKSKTPRFLPGETMFSRGGALQWRTSRGEILKTVPIGGVNPGQSITLKPAPDGELVAAFSTFDNVLRWKRAWTGETVREFPNAGLPFEFSLGGTRFASTSAGKIIVREVPSSREIAVIASPQAHINANMEISPDGARIAVWEAFDPKSAANIEVYDAQSGRKLFEVPLAKSAASVRFLRDNQLFVAAAGAVKSGRGPLVLRRFDAQGRETQKQNTPSIDFYGVRFRFASDAVFLDVEEESRPDTRSFFASEIGKPLARITAARWKALAPKIPPPARLGQPVSLRFAGAVAGKTLVTDGSNFWNGATGKLEFTLAPAISSPTAFDVSRDAKSVAVAGSISGGKMVGVWARAPLKLKNRRVKSISGRIEASDFGQAGEVWASDMQFSPDGRLLATASGLVSQAPPLIVQDAASGKVLWQWSWGEEFNGWGNAIGTRIDFAPEGKSLVFLDNILQQSGEKSTLTGNYGRLRRADPRSGEVTTEMRTLPSFALDFAPDGNSLAVSTQKGELKRFGVYSQFIATSYALELRDPQTLELEKSIAAPMALQQLRWSKNGQKIAAIGDDTSVYLLDVAAQKWTKLVGHTAVPRDVAWLSATKLASCGDDGQLIFWSIAEEKPLATTFFFRPADGRKAEFITSIPSGFFTASPGALPFVWIRKNEKLQARGISLQGQRSPAKVRAALAAQP